MEEAKQKYDYDEDQIPNNGLSSDAKEMKEFCLGGPSKDTRTEVDFKLAKNAVSSIADICQIRGLSSGNVFVGTGTLYDDGEGL